MKINGKDFINSLSIDERYNSIAEETVSLKRDNIKNWRERTNILSESDFQSELEENKYKLEVFSNVLGKNNFEKNYEKTLNETKWFKFFQLSFLDMKPRNYNEEYNFVYFIRNFLDESEIKIKEFMKIRSYPNQEKILDSVINALGVKLINVFQKTLIYELNMEREKGLLDGADSEARFHSFCKKALSHDYLLSFYKKYPVLMRLASIISIDFIQNIKEILDNYYMNNEKISKQLHLDNDLSIEEIEIDKGDSHQSGKTVAVLLLSNKTKIIYKPRNMKIVEAYNELIELFNKASNTLDMYIYESAIFDDFAFETIVKKVKCRDIKQVEKFYERFGQLISIMYVIKGTDLHMENVIACGEYPVVVDLETLIQQKLPVDFGETAAAKVAEEKLNNLVSNTALLPEKNFSIDVDLSALGGKEGKIVGEVEKVINENTDVMHIGKAQGELEGAENQPTLNESKVNYSEYMDFIIKGFTNGYHFFLENIDEVKERLALFDNKIVRVLIRNTMNYARILDMLHHPSCLKDFMSREEVLENFWNHILKNKKVMKSEIEDLRKDDIPVFFRNTSHTDLITSKGEKINDFFPVGSYAKLTSDVNKLSNDDMIKQIGIIKLKTGLFNPLKLANTDIIPIVNLKQQENNKQRLLKEAKSIANSIISSSVCSIRNTVSMASLQSGIDTYEYSVIDNSLYQGLTGVGLFFHMMWIVTKEEQYKEMRNRLVETVMNEQFAKDCSVISGDGSILILLMYMLKSGEDTLEEIAKITSKIDKNLESMEELDWVGGLSSILHCYINLFKITNNRDYYKMVLKIANIMRVKIDVDKMIGGFSHGCSAVSMVLYELYAITGKKKYRILANQILEKDQSYFCEEKKAWRDLRHADAYPSHWCHGSVGIGLSRIVINELDKNLDFESEITIALENTKNSQLTKDDTLCHGNLGKTDLFLKTGDFQTAFNIANEIITEKENIGFYNSNSLPNLENYSLFTGITGIGYQLLRIAYPEIVPSVLMLDFD